MSPLHRTAARFGVRGLTLPALAADEAPRGARLYGKRNPLLEYDNLVGEELLRSEPRAAAAAATPPPPDGEEGYGGAGAVPLEGGPEGGSGLGQAAARGGRGGGVAVLPYWRPLAALQRMRRAGWMASGSGIGGAAAEALLPRSSTSSSTSSSFPGSSARQRKATTAGASATAGEAAVGGGDGAATAAAGALRPFPALHYSLRHCNLSKQERAEMLTAAGVSPSYGMYDPRQPLLPGKRNVRLLQLLQVPMRAPDDAAGGGAAAGGDAGGGVEARPQLPSASIVPVGRGVVVEDEDEDKDVAVRLVNANHYVVLIKRVHLKHGPTLVDRMAAGTYMTVNRIRTTAQWAAGGGKERAAASVTAAAGAVSSYVSTGNGSRAGGLLAAGRGGGGLSRSARIAAGGGGSSFRSQRDVEAQAVAVAAAAAPLRGAAKVAYNVRRYYEMFEEPGKRQYDPLSEVCATDARGKAGKASLRPAATAAASVSNGGGGGDGALPVRSGGGAAPSGVSNGGGGGGAAPSGVSSSGGGGGDDDEAAASAAAQGSVGGGGEEDVEVLAAAKAAADAAVDPNGAAVAAVLRDLFPKSFQGLIPVTNHDAVDKLIYRWDAKMLALAAVVRDLKRLQVRQQRRRHHVDVEAAVKGADDAAAAPPPAAGGCCSGGGQAAEAAEAIKMVDQLRERAAKLGGDIRGLESRIESERERTLRKPVGTAYFAMFSNSQDAQMLAHCRRVVPPQGPGSLLSFDAVPAPAPDDVAWPGLWSTGSLEQILRRLAIVVPMAIIFAIPIGPLQGALASLDVSLCGGATSFEGIQLNTLYVEWFCVPKNWGVKLWKSLLTGVLPSVLGLVWTSVCMPQLLFLCSSISRRELSLSGQERQMQNWFFWYSLVNTFLGAILGGGVLSQLGTYLANPVKLLDKVGRALPTTANFFIQFCIARAFFTNFVRLIWPHAGAMMSSIFRSLLALGRPPSLHAAALAHMPPSSRAASYYTAILQVFMFGCAFAVVAPIILPCCWLFFLTGFFAYRYSILYLYERSYESGGLMWPVLFNQMLGFLLLMELFSGAVFIVSGAWVLAVVIWITLTPAMLVFWRYCSLHYLEPLQFPPLSVVASEPRGVRLSPLVYMPPALRPGAIGWYPEQGKVWEKYGIPKHW